ncbi:hypothetical protein LCGC14_1611140 [marine sediment metagenome]|uniref:DUF218 domain-containing protein n=1 Tax=marine sediment metagenome TaxID=412755 RepID=A0A0F9IUZ3_9ZZZZ
MILVILIYFLLKFSIEKIGFFLSEQQPITSKVLVVEGWQQEDALVQAYEEFVKGQHTLVITTGGPEAKNFSDKFDSYAEQATFRLESLGIPSSKIVIIATPESAQNRTFLSAVYVRDWMEFSKSKITSFNVITTGVHSRRTHYLYEQAFEGTGIDIGVLSVQPSDYQLDSWWQTSVGAKTVITEFIGWLHVLCCFHTPEPNSQEEKWAVLPSSIKRATE